DIMMPRIDGYETCRRLKAMASTKEIPVIFMTALLETGHKVKGLEAGAVDYITKPFQLAELLARLAVHLHNRELTKRLQEAKELLETRVEERTAELAGTNNELQAEISERKQAEEQLAILNQRLESLVEQRTEQLNRRNAELIASEERYRNLVETMQEGILIVDGNGRLTYVNRQMSNMLGMVPDKLIGRECAHFIEAKDRAVFEAKLKSANGQFALKFEVNFTRSDGHIVSTLVTPTTLYDGEGRFHGFFAVVTDITHLKQLQTQLLHAQKLESIGQLAAGIAHEINTPTQYVINNARFLDDAFKELVEVLAADEAFFDALKNGLSVSVTLEEVEMSRKNHQLDSLFKEISGAFADTFEGLERISNIVGSVKRFAQPGQDATALADLNDAIRNTITVSTNEWKYVANIETDLDPALPLIPCNISAINQVVLVLIVNAAHAIADQQIDSDAAGKGTITLKTTNLGDFAEIRITDTGSGIPENIRTRIFDPFFTTKSVGKGSGQGLAIARTIITESHHGTIDFETGVGCGTTFIIHLPLQNKDK
ncbi:MAG: PAS domain S-box protein, partial [Desulfoprunum sp.]|nr:PAS domain S-box protein [Desulfoprunum sp.]